MDGLLIEYEYEGDEAWSETIQEFLRAIAADARSAGRFRYHVFVKIDGKSRTHIPSWDSPETLAHIQAQDYFKTFAAAVQKAAGGALKPTKAKFAG